ncbi:prephenate dehydrogenase [Salibacterium qingdaonense]|uniref:Prephenate dehydrogenase n=1 Tax=Salibacterium qingdaonense TaxID=266892 RepID=A0A1I4M3K3_9BACI|nr:prephenate dehydrogenase [Salibacterium qingdaonense]SFL97666.1 prephenate dehydrogenase [Salibacterium qingdaonense]
MPRNICVVGMGLIGGSIALSIKNEHDVHITGVDIDENQLRLARSLGVIDDDTTDISTAAGKAELIILAVPVTKTEVMIEQLLDMPLRKGTIITDVGSTKKRIVEKAGMLHEKGVEFVGGHPMAGSHKSGVQAAKAHLFENAFYVLTPVQGTLASTIMQLQDWLKGTRAQFLELTADQHDELAGLISHFPHIIAAGLVQQVKNTHKDDSLVTRMAAGGFRDITRIASASPVMWRDILLHNKQVMLDLMKQWKAQMESVEAMLKEEDSEGILEYFGSAKSFRDGLPAKERGVLPSHYDLFVDVPDHPGVISDITGMLAESGISIINIRIIETREDIMGVLQLTFRSDQERLEGKTRLEQAFYETYIMN